LFKGGAAILADSQNGDIIILSTHTHKNNTTYEEARWLPTPMQKNLGCIPFLLSNQQAASPFL
jgi:hypothetical protein